MDKIKKNISILILSVLVIFTGCVEGIIYDGPEINIKQGTTDIASGSGVFDFGYILPDGDGNTTSGYVIFDIENLGDEDLVISSVTMSSGDTDAFDLVNSTVQTLSPSGTTQFSIRFDPLEALEYSATVIIANNDKNERSYSFTISGTGAYPFVNTIQKITADDSGNSDFFGESVSISGDYAIVGAKGKNENTGAAYIFHRTAANTWDSGVKIVALDIDTGDNFGRSVSIDGDYAIVGAKNGNGGTGAAYIFHRTGLNIWDSGMKIVATDPQNNDSFGGAVAISGDYVIVGAEAEDGGPGDPLSIAGAAYIFHRTGLNTWDSGAKIVATDPQTNDIFGCSVAISGDYTIVGARLKNEGPDLGGAGAAYIFHRTGLNTWDSGVKIISMNPQYAGFFGHSVSINGDYAIVGAIYEDGGPDDSFPSAGAAYIFHRTTTNTWDSGVKIGATDPQDSDSFGYSVSIDSDYAIIGAIFEDGGPGDPLSNAGAAYIFHRTALNTWDSGVKIAATDPQDDDFFGFSIGISGDYTIVGANQEDSGPGDPLANAGAVYIFE
ncbi:MAG: hypothetical protein JXJ04_14405 [Spirochaetales bacterium]|nr:hypothetical protein [Spirochaetales bacterium]